MTVKAGKVEIVSGANYIEQNRCKYVVTADVIEKVEGNYNEVLVKARTEQYFSYEGEDTLEGVTTEKTYSVYGNSTVSETIEKLKNSTEDSVTWTEALTTV